jgi:tRNA nucleotidyltransferase (CCA-adding enzyme)
VPDSVRGLIETLEAGGHASFVVGGAVRDLLLRRSPGDFDVATAAPVETLLELFPRAIPIGLQHGTVMVPTVDGPVDVTNFRGGPCLADDLAHRDFTVNAMAWHPAREELIDPHDGQGDLTKARLRAVGDADARFAEDPLRTLRGVRLAAEIELEVSDDLLSAMRRATPALARVARERVRYELKSLLLSTQVARGLSLLRSSGLEASLAPGVRNDAADVVAALPAELELRLAGWLRGTRSTAILRNLRFSRRTNLAVEQLLRWHPIDAGVDPSRDPNVRRHMKRVGPDRVQALIALRQAELAYEASDAATELAALLAGIARVEAAGRVSLQRQDLAINGRQVMEAMGKGPGPHIGRALAWLTDCVLEDPSRNTLEELQRLITSFVAEQNEEESA